MHIEDIALVLIPGLGCKGAAHLLEHFGNAAAIFAASEDRLVAEARLRPDLARAIVARKTFAQAERELNRCRKYGIEAVASTDSNYPQLLREIPDYPHVLYIRGNPEILSRRCISMVGTRRITAYGSRVCADLIRGLSERVRGAVIVSGLAFGIDAACHRAAIDCGIPTAGILAVAHPDVAPAQHTRLAEEIVDRGGALVTELHSQSRQTGRFFLARNRIIAGLSAGTVVVESPDTGGSLYTAHCADGYERTVMAVPGRITDTASQGTNKLIRNRKAQAVLSADDIVRELMWDLDPQTIIPRTPEPAPTLTDDERRLLRCFPQAESRSTDELLEASGLDYGSLSALLTGLELSGAVRQLPGNRYEPLIDLRS